MIEEFKNNPAQQVDTTDDEAVREYGRQRAMDALIRDALEVPDTNQSTVENVVTMDSVRKKKRSIISIGLYTAAACLAFLLVTLIEKTAFTSGKKNTAVIAPVALDKRWNISPSGDADFTIVKPNLIKLRSGELYFASNQPAHLIVETPSAVATAEGTKFYIGHHANSTSQATTQATTMKTSNKITRLLVLAGVVTMSNGAGSIQAAENEAVISNNNNAPEKIVVEANSRFATDLYARLSKENAGENIFFSPYSISTALLMATEGARGDTAHEMGQVLGFPESLRRVSGDTQSIPWETGKLHLGFSELNRLFNRDRNTANEVSSIELEVANALWGDKTYPFQDTFVNTINDAYDTEGLQLADFKSNYESERKRINQWVEGKTRGRIKDLLPNDSLDELTRLVLVNAVYFKGDWATPFNANMTRNADFTLAGGETVIVPLMSQRKITGGRYAAFNGDGSFFDTPRKTSPRATSKNYPDEDGFSMMELPYEGGEVSMIVIAPNNADGIDEIESQLSDKNIASWVNQMKSRKLHVTLPKFKSESAYKMNQTLSAIGMKTAFQKPNTSGSGADFGGMTTSTDIKDKLYISALMHKSFIEVNEKGTEAAAATAVVGARTLSLSTPFTPHFRADRPFIYMIKDNKTGSLLFLGRMMNPKGK